MRFLLQDRAIRAIVLDIEGTTTPIAFVYDVLFPFARTRLSAYLEDPAHDAAVAEVLAFVWRTSRRRRFAWA